MKNIKICDTTLRDSEYSAEFNMSAREKVEIAKQIERLGVDIIEISTGSDALFEVAKELKSSLFSVACTLDGFAAKEVESALAAARRARVNFLLNDSCPAGYETALKDAVKAAKERGYLAQVTVDALSMDDDAFLKHFCAAAKEAGVDSLCVYDDVGYCAPTEFFHIVKNAFDALGGIAVAVKCKNDLGMAVANVLSAIKAGASIAECCVNGLGRRAGNAALEEVVMGLSARKDYYEADTGIRKRLLYRTSRMVAAVVGQPVPGNKPVVGSRALARGNSNLKEGASFAAIRPEEIGVIRNNLVLGANSSPHIFEERVGELGYLLNPVQMGEAYKQFLDLCKRKDAVTDRDIEAIVAPMGEGEKKFELLSFVINTGNEIDSTATVVLLSGSGEKKATANGYGPVDAAFKAVDEISGFSVSLDDFSLQSVTEGEDALGDAVVRVRSGDRVFTGRGVSTDIVEASIRAYVNALNKVAAVN